MPEPKYLIDGEYAPPTKRKETTDKYEKLAEQARQLVEDMKKTEAEAKAKVSSAKSDREIREAQAHARMAEADRQEAERAETTARMDQIRQDAAKREQDIAKSIETKEQVQTYEHPRARAPKEGSIAEALVGFDPIATIITEIADVGVHLKEGAAEAKLEGDNLEAGVRASAYMATQIGIGLVEGYTFFVRPHKWVETGQAIVKGVTDVVTSPDPLKVIATGVVATGAMIESDPVAFVGRTTGSIIGGIAAGKTISKIRGPKTVSYEPPTDTDIQDFLVPEDIYPHQVALSTDEMTLIPESTVIISDLGGDFLDSHLVPRGKWSSSRITGYRQTGADLIQELVPEGMGEPTTIYHPMSVPYPIFEHTPGLELNVGKIVLPRGLKVPIALGTIAGVASIEHLTVETPDLALEQKTQELIDAALKQEVSITTIQKIKGESLAKTKIRISPEYTIKPEIEDLVIPSPFPPQYTPKPIQETTPIISPITRIGLGLSSKTVQEPKLIQETKIKASIPQIPHYPVQQSIPKKAISFYTPKKRKTKRIKLPKNLLVGFEVKTTKMLDPEDIIGKKKKFRWPKL